MALNFECHLIINLIILNHFNVRPMKRTRSALSLKNIAQSIHRSIQLHAHRNQPDLKLNAYRSQSHLLIKEPEKRQ